MAEIHELIERVTEPGLKAQLQAAVDKLAKQKKFGLVFEEHLPECTPLYEVPVKKGRLVSRKQGATNDLYVVLTITDGVATCLPKNGGEAVKLPVDELVSVAEFGEPIYPYLQPVDTVCHAPDSDLWHTLIEADNYHALQLLEYLYAGKVDCIYIDPPYNTGAKDWKYNNDYVDGSDTYRHSKWLSMMQKRLRLAKRLLDPKNSVLIVTIDEKEYLHLGCLLEELFPDASLQMISTAIKPSGSTRGTQFSRVDEYIFFVQIGEAFPQDGYVDMLYDDPDVVQESNVTWQGLRRRGSTSWRRSDRPGQFYPIYIDLATNKIAAVGNPLPLELDRHSVMPKEGTYCAWPLDPQGREGRWQVGPERLREQLEEGTAFLSKASRERGSCSIKYLKDGDRNRVLQGEFAISGKDENGALIIAPKAIQNRRPKTMWVMKSHDASAYGTALLNKFIGEQKFSFPKSLYAVRDAIRFFVADKPNALIVDFFAGSGTTLHAVNLLNAEDGGHRRCILVTNNEVSADEAKTLAAQGYQPGDPEWEKLGIARYVTWPRTVCSIEGHDVNDQPLKGSYLGSDRPMSDGFQANAAYFKLGFLDKTSVALGEQFHQMLPTLWMKAGAKGPCPTLDGGPIPPMLVLPENGFAVLTEEAAFEEFAAEVNAHPEIETVYLITDYEAGFRVMVRSLKAPHAFQLYRDYLDNFRIKTGRDRR